MSSSRASEDARIAVLIELIKEAYVDGRIEVDQLERLVQVALTAPEQIHFLRPGECVLPAGSQNQKDETCM